MCPAHWPLLPTATVTAGLRDNRPVAGPCRFPQLSEVLSETSEVTRSVAVEHASVVTTARESSSRPDALRWFVTESPAQSSLPGSVAPRRLGT